MPEAKNNEKVPFIIRLTDYEWDREIGAWHCSTIKIPGVEATIYNQTVELTEGREYKLDKVHGLIRWNAPKPEPQSLTILFKGLSTRKDTDYWKFLAILLPVIATIVSPVILELVKLGLGNKDYSNNVPISEKRPLEPTVSPIEAPAPPIETPSIPNPKLATIKPTTDASFDKEQALNLVNDWLEAKSRIFGEPFDEELLSKFTHVNGPLYREIISPGKGIDSLKSSNSHYTFRISKIDKVWSFLTDNEQPELKVRVYEESTLYTPSGVEGKNPKISQNTFTFVFKKEGSDWKIYDYQRETE